MDEFKRVTALVVGDVLLDTYWRGRATRIAPEAPVPVVDVEEKFHRAGGAANVAMNMSRLGAQVHVVGITGDDEAGTKLRSILTEAGIHLHLFAQRGLPTVEKVRVFGDNRQLLVRADFEESYDAVDKSALTRTCAELVSRCDVIVVSDYGKGTLSDVQAVIRAARSDDVTVLVDPKGDGFERYSGASYLTPNLEEFRRVAGPCDDVTAIVERGSRLVEELSLDGMLVTCGADSWLLIGANADPATVPNTAVNDVCDVTGAGDTVIAVMALSLAADVDPVTSVKRAVAAGVVVGKLGTSTLSSDELCAAIHDRCGVVTSRVEAKRAVDEAKGRGEKVVMTNGCFDLLHAGHVDYLRKTRALGDRLLVAVNDDASVRRLKGPTRPVVDLQQRMQVLAGLSAVDWVVSFPEDTPVNLIAYLSPDVLVKGADYELHQVVGGENVLARGGEVKIVNSESVCSTTGIIRSIVARNTGDEK